MGVPSNFFLKQDTNINSDIVNATVYKTYNNNFCIFSVGSCGSIWLAGLLHYHPEIACSAGFDHTLHSTYFDYNDKEFEQNLVRTLDADFIKYGTYKYQANHLVSYITPLNYRQYLQPHAYAAHEVIKHYHKMHNISHYIPDRIEKSCLDLLFKEMKDFYPNKNFYGNVHGMYCENYHNLNYQSKVNTIFADYIRHPVGRLESFLNSLVELYKYDNVFIRQVDNFVYGNALCLDWVKKFSINIDDHIEKLRLFANLGFLNKGFTKVCADDIRSLNVTRILFERIKIDPSYFRWVVSYLTGGYIIPSNDYIDHVYEGLSNTSRVSGKTKAFIKARDQWEEWPDWQKAIFKQHCEELNLKVLYSQFGYDLSFVR